MVTKKSILRTGAAVAIVAAAGLAAAPANAGDLLGGLLGGGSTAQPVKPMYGNLKPFYGNLKPFYGNLKPFYGNLKPFWGNLKPFWGDTAAFYGDLSTFWGKDNPVVGSGAPQYAKVGDYWTVAGNNWNTTFTNWDVNYSATSTSLNQMVNDARAFWGDAVRAKTGKSFDEGFANKILSDYGINLKDPKSLAQLDQSERAYFFLEWYDGLMNFAGTDHVDHWMKTINWSPALTQDLPDNPVAIGILDQTLSPAEFPKGQVTQYNGTSTFSDGHGAAVASLLVAPHDGKGVMGMVPDAKVYAYNPFDGTGTANWGDVTAGVQKLKASGASVVNMSLGVPGMTFDPGWNNVFANLATTLILKNTVFVVAAGNEGVTQTQNINWLPLNPSVIVVGSVDLDGNISNFSNRPGEACMATLGLLCLPGEKLKDHFIVAPGELILVSDGQGGVTRQIGTSFAAPLVTGAVAMIHQRWPWLKNFPLETADIIFDSAKDLGAPGVDPVYGHGLLDVQASQSPLNWNNLVWYTVKDGQKTLQTQNAVLQTYQAEKAKAFSTDGIYFYAFEPLSLLAYRDFAIPLSQKLIGQTAAVQGATMPLQGYLRTRMDGWVSDKTSYRGMSNFAGGTMPVANPWGADMTMSFAPRSVREGYRDEGPQFQTRLDIAGEHSKVTVGFGDGAPALFAQSGFAQAADYDVDRGGADPLLGLASGGAYAGWSYSVSDKLQISAGAMRRDDVRDRRLLPALGYDGNGAATYSADAAHMSLAYSPVAHLTFTGAYTRLHEATGLLGVQSFDPADFRHGSTSDGYTVGVNWAASSKLSLMATGTVGKTRQGSADQALSVDKDGLTTSSFELGLARSDLFAKGDRFQVTVSQPMFVEKGHLNFQNVQVVDRETGELGIVTDRIDISGKRRLAGEALYLRSLDGGRSDVAFFGRVESETDSTANASYIAGARYRFAF